MAYFVRNLAGWNDLTKNPEEIIGSYIKRRAMLLEQLAKQQVGKKSRRLQQSINHTMYYGAGGFIASIGSDNKIARLHHDGTKPHIIVPKSAKTLRFNSHGKIVYAKVVHHPGTKPNKYLTDNLRKVIR
jgi:hypothetical protein